MKRFTAVLIAVLMILSSGSALANLGYLGHSYALDYFVYLPVVTSGRGPLVFQSAPGGSFMSKYSYSDGDLIYVNHYFRDGNYALAYDVVDDIYGYVDASYIDWSFNPYNSYDGLSDSDPISDPYDLYYYDYFRVITNGRGNLVFQREPRGSFMSNFSYSDGDWIYVNPYYRAGNYALAYDNGTYGYVDVSYIDW